MSTSVGIARPDWYGRDRSRGRRVRVTGAVSMRVVANRSARREAPHRSGRGSTVPRRRPRRSPVGVRRGACRWSFDRRLHDSRRLPGARSRRGRTTAPGRTVRPIAERFGRRCGGCCRCAGRTRPAHRPGCVRAPIRRRVGSEPRACGSRTRRRSWPWRNHGPRRGSGRRCRAPAPTTRGTREGRPPRRAHPGWRGPRSPAAGSAGMSRTRRERTPDSTQRR